MLLLTRQVAWLKKLQEKLCKKKHVWSWYSCSGNWNCTKGFLMIVCTITLQNYYEEKIVK